MSDRHDTWNAAGGERMARYLAGDMPPDERLEFEEQILSDDTLAAELYGDSALRAALEKAARTKREQDVASKHSRGTGQGAWWKSPWVRIGIPMAAMVTIAALSLWPNDPTNAPEVFRGAPGQMSPVKPFGKVTTVPDVFVWTRDARVSRYRFELFNAGGESVHVALTGDTLVTVDGAFEVPTKGFWVVTPVSDVLAPTGSAITVRYNATTP